MSTKKPSAGFPAFLKILLKIAFVGALLTFLIQKGFISVEATRRAFSQTDHIVPAIAAMIAGTFLGVFRWQWLLQAQGIRLRLSRTLQLSLIGNFFNIALPGAVSGDFVKAFYVGNEVQGQRARAFGSILFDRLAGLSALVLVAATALLLDLGALLGTPLIRALQFFILTSAIVVILSYSYLFLVREHHDPFLRLLRGLERKFAKVGSVTRIYESVRHYHSHRIAVLKVLAISILIHLLVGFACLNFLAALGDAGIEKLPLFVVVPMGLLVTAVPVAPAGVGTGHAAFSYLFHFLGSQRGADVFSLYVLIQLALGGIGGLVYLRFKAHSPKLELLDAVEA